MTFFLFYLSVGLGIGLFLKHKQLTGSQNEHTISRKRLRDADQKISALILENEQVTSQHKIEQAFNLDRVKKAHSQVEKLNQKYGDLISREATINDLDVQITALSNRLDQLESQSQKKEKELAARISILQVELRSLEEQEFFESFGFYQSKYDFQSAEAYKQRLDRIRDQQKQMIKMEEAAVCETAWVVSGSKKEGKKMTNNFIKLVLRAFNGESDASVAKVKYSNVKTMENRIRKAYDDLNKLSKTTNCHISSKYLDLKLQELWLTHEYQERKYQEQEEQRIIRDQMREEEKAIRELDKIRQEAEREERRYQEALEKARRDVESATGEVQERLLSQIEELQQRLTDAEANKERAISQAQLTKSGHVYIISNIGSFGENIYKIGMTRRLEPMDRVKELGDASVPFPFDVHAMIFCHNAPDLESRLHKHFHGRRLNKVNERKEFFRVSLDEIVYAVQDIDNELKTCKSEITFTKIADAADYRKTLSQEREPEQTAIGSTLQAIATPYLGTVKHSA
jgi:hypothetical protein